MAVVTVPKFKRSIEFCAMAGPVDGVGDGQSCHRLPMHRGQHNAFVRGNGFAKPKPTRVRTIPMAKSRRRVASSTGR